MPLYYFLIDVGPDEMVAVINYTKDTILDLSPIFLLIVGVSIALLVFGGLMANARR